MYRFIYNYLSRIISFRLFYLYLYYDILSLMPFYQIEGEEVEEENLNDADSEPEEEEVEEPTSGKSQ